MRYYISLILTFILCCGCGTSRKTVETIRTDTLVQVVHQRDSIYIEQTKTVHDSIVVRDSIVIVKDEHGSVVWGERWHSEETSRQSDKERTEARETANDSIASESRHEVEKEQTITEKKDGWRLDFRAGMLMGMFLALIGVYGFGKLFK